MQIDIDLLASVLGDHNGISHGANGDQAGFNCPFCEENGKSPDNNHHLYINISYSSSRSGLWICYRCGEKGGYQGLLRRLGIEDRKSYPTKKQFTQLVSDWEKSYSNSKDLENDKYYLPTTLPLCSWMDSYRYLKDRGISDDDMVYYGMRIGSGRFTDRVVVPVVEDGKIIFWTARAIFDDMVPRYLNPSVGKNGAVFNLEGARKMSSTVVICEGVFDAIRVGRNAVSLFSKTLSSIQLKKLYQAKFFKYIVSLDGDARDETYKICKQLDSYGLSTYYVLLPDKVDPDDYGRENMNHLLKDAKKFHRVSSMYDIYNK